MKRKRDRSSTAEMAAHQVIVGEYLGGRVVRRGDGDYIGLPDWVSHEGLNEGDVVEIVVRKQVGQVGQDEVDSEGTGSE